MLSAWFREKSGISTDKDKIDELLTRSVVDVVEERHLREALFSGRRLRVKLGIDPTSPHLHLGRAVTLLKLRDFQELGHQIVFIVGDTTGVVGDTSDKESERPMLTRAHVEDNARTYLDQVGKLLDVSRVEMHYNSEWLLKLHYHDIGEQADQFSVADFIARENIKKRLEGGKRVSLREVLYPLMQGYDSVAVRADVEIGGTDQRFNLLAGRRLQEKYGQAAQNILMLELIPGLDGRKMSSSWGNTINLTDAAGDMYGKVMSLADELIAPYFMHATRLALPEVRRVEAGLKAGSLHPKEAKMKLAYTITALYHGSEAAGQAEKDFGRAFKGEGVPESTPEAVVALGASLDDVLISKGLVASKSEFRRLVEGGAIGVVGGTAITDIQTIVMRDMDVRIGKKRFLKIRVKGA